MDIYTYIIENSSATHAGIAKIVHQAFKNEYRVHIIGKTAKWFKVNKDGELSLIDDIILRQRLSTDIAEMVIEARKRLINEKDNAFEIYKNRKDSLNNTLNMLLQEKRNRNQNINTVYFDDRSKEIESKIKEIEKNLLFIRLPHELFRLDVIDAKLIEIKNIENKLYNSSFKDGIMKALAEMFYVAV
jgi:hypothetical protein